MTGCWVPKPASLALDARLVDHLVPALNVARQHGQRILRAAGVRVEIERLQFLDHFRVARVLAAQNLDGLGVPVLLQREIGDVLEVGARRAETTPETD